MAEDRALAVSKKIPKADKSFPAESVKQLCDIPDNIRDKFYLAWHIETGVRVSDIVGQKKKNSNDRELGQEIHNIDWEENRIWTYDHKKDKWRWVYFPQKVRSLLKIWLKEREVLGITGRELFPFSEKTCNRIIKRWCKAIGFKYADQAGAHWCRHTFIRLSRAAGRDIKAVQQNTGDSIKTLLEWYSDLSSEDMHRELDKKQIS